jgi:hypothetical protein
VWPSRLKADLQYGPLKGKLNFFILIPGSAIQRCGPAVGDDGGYANTVQSTEVSTSVSR